jgi:hypothetical protein
VQGLWEGNPGAGHSARVAEYLRHSEETMERSTAVYRNFQLVAIEQPSGRYRVEISSKGGGGEPVLTNEFRDVSGAIASARNIIDNVLLKR